MTFCREGDACLSSIVRKKSPNWFAFSTDEKSETLESSAINDWRSMLAMFLTVPHKVEGYLAYQSHPPYALVLLVRNVRMFSSSESILPRRCSSISSFSSLVILSISVS